jgi:hypothetical protein
MNYISLGSECSCAAALRHLGLRDYALPFDWISSDPSKIYSCIVDDFKEFHQNLTLNYKSTRLIDEYGFEFPHDYPTSSEDINVGEGAIDEAKIIDGWEKCHDLVLEKYKRRIERFNRILLSPMPVIALYRGDPLDLYFFRAAFLEKYNKTNIIYVVSSSVMYDSEDTIVCNTEETGKWNLSDIWSNAILKAKERINGLG